MSKISTYSLADEPLQLSDRLIGTEAPRPTPSATPLATKNFSLGELLQLFSSEFPAASLQAVLDTGNTATQDITLTGTITTSVIKPDEIEDVLGSQGNTFQFLSKAANGINWVDLPLSIPTLDEVLSAGDTSSLTPRVGSISLFDQIGYVNIKARNNKFYFVNRSTQTLAEIYQNTISIKDLNGNYFNIQKPSTLSNNHTAFFQDTSGTVAYLQDIPDEIQLTTVGSSGPATLIGNILNIPVYSGGSGTVPTLDEVLDEGNTSELNANIGELGLYDSLNSQYYKIVANDELFKFKNNLGSNIFIVGYSEFSLYNRTGSIAANFSSSLLTTTRNFEFPNASGTIALTSNIPSLSGYVPYTGATSNVNLGNNDLYVNEIFLYDGPNDNYGTIHFTDGNFHIEDADGHPLFVVEDGFLQIHKDATIQSNLYTTDLTEVRDHYLPDESGTIALTSNIPLVDAIPTDGSNNAVSSNGVFDALATKQASLGFTPENVANKTTNLFLDQASNVKYPSAKAVVDYALYSKFPQFSFKANNTSTNPATAQDIYFQQSSKQTYTGTVTWSGTTSPSGTTNHSFNWIRIGNMVTLNITLVYGTAGSANTGVIIPLLSSMPTPVIPDGLGASLRYIYPAYGKMSLNEASITTAASEAAMRINAGFDGYEFVITQASTSAKVLKITCQYFTA